MLINLADTYKPGDKQQIVHGAPEPWIFMGGAMGGGKSVGGCGHLVDRGMRYPGSRYAIVRRQLSVLRRTTLVTFRKTCPPDLIVNDNRQEHVITLAGGTEIIFLDADEAKDPDLNRLRSLDIAGFFIDEAPEVTDKVFRILVTRTNRWLLPDGTRPPRFGLLGGNPEPGWCYDRFVGAQHPNHRYIPFTMFDNPGITQQYIDDQLEILTDEEIEKYVHGKWVFSDDPNQLIKHTWLRNATRSEGEQGDGEGEMSLGVDVAWFGDDKSVLALCYENMVYKLITPKTSDGVPIQSTFMLAEYIEGIINEYAISHDRVVIDAVGVGAGVYDKLRADGFNVKAHMGGAAPTTRIKTHTFKNMRTQSYWHYRELLRTGEIEIPDEHLLKADTLAIRYTISGDRKITLERKDLLKKRIGRSPDYSDAVAMAFSHKYIGGGIIESSIA